MFYDKDNKPITIGSRVTSFRGEAATVESYTTPSGNSSGRIHVTFESDQERGEFFPGVFGLTWKDEV